MGESSLFEAFDLDALEDPGFKEDAVREEIIAPILKRLGYTPTGQTRVQRSQSLVHPFVRIGTRKHPVNIIPDYTLWHGDKALLVLDAKAPSESVVQSAHTEQAYSYAIHPEVRAPNYALCNGRRLVVYDLTHFDPVLDVAATDYDRRWSDIERVLRPQSLLNPAMRDFDPDLGLALQRMGLKSDEPIELRSFHLIMVSKVEAGVYCAATNTLFEGQRYLASIDFPEAALEPLLSCLAKPLLDGVLLAVSRSPFHVFLDQMVEVDLVVTLGALTQGEHDCFVPLDVRAVRDTRLDRTEKPPGEPVPHYIHSLRRAFETPAGRLTFPSAAFVLPTLVGQLFAVPMQTAYDLPCGDEASYTRRSHPRTRALDRHSDTRRHHQLHRLRYTARSQLEPCQP